MYSTTDLFDRVTEALDTLPDETLVLEFTRDEAERLRGALSNGRFLMNLHRGEIAL